MSGDEDFFKVAPQTDTAARIRLVLNAMNVL